MANEITLRDMSERIGVSHAYLSDIENNRGCPLR
ncbi:helix-turn-helix domain-containing protein [Microaerobacter geothermalis]